jgi:hypothetical protein
MNKNRINQLFFANLVMIVVSFIILWILNNHFLPDTRSNQLALLVISALNIIMLSYVSYLSFKQRLVLQGSLILIFICFIAFGTYYLYVIYNLGNGIDKALQNSNLIL